MIEYKKVDNYFTEPADARVIPVNCLGALGAGLAKAYREYPDTIHQDIAYYKGACATQNLDPGEILVMKSGIIFAATKGDWRKPSQIEWIEEICCLLEARDTMMYREAFDIEAPRSILLPKLGCGYGGLNWQTQVMPLYDKYFTRSTILYKVSV